MGERRARDGEQAERPPERAAQAILLTKFQREDSLLQRNPGSLSSHPLPLPAHRPRKQGKRNPRGGASSLLLTSAEGIHRRKGCARGPLSALGCRPGHHSCHCPVFPVRTGSEGGTHGLWGLLSHRTPVPSLGSLLVVHAYIHSTNIN